MIIQALLLLLCLVSLVASSANVISSDVETIGKGKYQYYHDENSSCSSIVMINVGTAMSLKDYSDIATDIVTVTNEDIVVIIIDNNPRRIAKTNPKKFSEIANAIIVGDLSTNIPICQSIPASIMIGGHSAGGQATIEAIQEKLLTFPVAGYIGLAPFEVNVKTMTIETVPSLVWGFSRTSCLVTQKKAGVAAYQISSPEKGRVFYQVRTFNRNTVTGGPHCSFTNCGCFWLCSGGAKFKWVPDKVADSVGLFVKAISSGQQISKEYFEIDQPDVDLYVNDDEVPSL